METPLLQHIRRYYETPGTVHVSEARQRTEGKAAELAKSLGNDFPTISGPAVQDYGKCVELRVRLDPDAPPLEAGREIVSNFIAARGRPWIQISLFLSWVGPFALVRAGTYSLDTTKGLLLNQVVGDEETARAVDTCRSRLRSVGYTLLTEEDLREPVELGVDLVREKDGSLALPPFTVGKCLFYPWWTGELPSPERAWNSIW